VQASQQSGLSQPERLLRLPEVESLVGLRKSAIYSLMGQNPPAFPRAIKLSRRAVCWQSSAVAAWIADRVKTGGQ
jgi:prophage regulatory protein